MAVPKHRTPKSDTKTRHSTWVALNRTRLIRQTHIVTCASCGEPKLSHTICPACGAQGAHKLKALVTPEAIGAKAVPEPEQKA